MRRLLLLATLLASCATERIASGNPVRIAASHYESMRGVKLKDGDPPTTCNREMITGSHIQRWYCRFGEDPTQYQLGGRIVFDFR
jgi:hypothetical protein